MRQGRFLSIGLAALAMVVSACSESTNPTASTGGSSNTGGAPTSDAGILSKLQNPEVGVAVTHGVPTRLLFTAGASGQPTSESMRAARSIESVEFAVFSPEGRLLVREMTKEVLTTGVVGPESNASITVFAEKDWGSVSITPPGSYVVGTLRGLNGEVMTIRAEMPEFSGT